MNKMFNIFSIILLYIFLHSTAIATIYYVKTNGNDSNSGTSWSTAFQTIKKALNVANAGDTIWVAKGTYIPDSTYGLGTDPPFKHFRLKDSVKIFGGFAGTESSIYERTNYGVGGENETILSGDLGGGIHCYHVIFHPDTTYQYYKLSEESLLDGFTIKDGVTASGSTPHNHAGGLFNGSGSNAVFKNCTFINNDGEWAGAIYIGGSSPKFIHCLIYNNTCANYGYGGAIYNNSGNPTFINCTIVNNYGGYGGGIFLYKEPNESSSSIILMNSIIWDNNASYGKQIYISSSCNAYLYYCNIRNQTNDIINYGALDTLNLIFQDPLFVNASNNDFRIIGYSPCADAGNNDYNSETYDIRGYNYPRKVNKETGGSGTIDLGAFEYNPNYDPLPVELISFNAIVKGETILLNWQTETESQNYGFEIERKLLASDENKSSKWMKIGFVQGSGNSNSRHSYSYEDKIARNGKYQYRLKQIDIDGNFKYSTTVEVEINSIPKAFSLKQNYPNPFNPITTIIFTLNEPGFTTLKIYNSIGEEITTLVKNEYLEAGEYHQRVFDASKLPSGVYIAILQSGNKVNMKKMLLLK